MSGVAPTPLSGPLSLIIPDEPDRPERRI